VVRAILRAENAAMAEHRVAIYPNGVKLIKWPHKQAPTAESVAASMIEFGYKVYDLQTVPAWFERSRHAHDEPEIRGAVDGVITFHFDEYPVTIEAGDILLIPGGIAHEVITHNGRTFSAYKGSLSGERKVTEHADGSGSIEDLTRKAAGSA
jgi:mannose-6-phosphate isomerase-like protein (cupin superfamily)